MLSHVHLLFVNSPWSFTSFIVGLRKTAASRQNVGRVHCCYQSWHCKIIFVECSSQMRILLFVAAMVGHKECRDIFAYCHSSGMQALRLVLASLATTQYLSNCWKHAGANCQCKVINTCLMASTIISATCRQHSRSCLLMILLGFKQHVF